MLCGILLAVLLLSPQASSPPQPHSQATTNLTPPPTSLLAYYQPHSRPTTNLTPTPLTSFPNLMTSPPQPHSQLTANLTPNPLNSFLNLMTSPPQPHSQPTTNLIPSLLPTSFPAYYQPHSHATNLIPQPHDQPTTASFPGLQQLHYQVTLPVSLTGFQQAFAHNTTGKGSPEFQVALITFSLPVMLTSSLELRLRYRVHFRAG